MTGQPLADLTPPAEQLSPATRPTARAFNAFVAPYLKGNDAEGEAHRHNFVLKLLHSYQVLARGEAIVQGLVARAEAPFDTPRIAALATIACLVHDAGRFPQYARYRTFHDGNSENHALLGARCLTNAGVLHHLEPSERRLVLGAVALHNKRALPEAPSRPLKHITQVVRDADKIDIMRVMLDHFDTEDADNPVVTLHVAPHPTAYTRAILDSVREGSLADYRQMVYVNDFKLLLCGWVHDLNYPESITLLRELGYLNRLVAHLPDLPEMHEVGASVLAKLET